VRSLSERQQRRSVLGGLFAAAALVSVGGVVNAAGAAGSSVRSPRRIVSIGSALTEMIYALNAEAGLAGVDTTSLYPPAARALPNVGYARSLSAEGVLSLAPTQIVATEDAGPPAVLRQLEAAGIPVAILAANHRFDGMLERLSKIGEITERSPAAAQLAQSLRGDWAQVQAQVASRTAVRRGKLPRVLFVLSHSISQVMVAGDTTSAQAMIEYAGARNALTGVSGYKPLTPEAAVAAAPDIILGTEQGLQAAGGVDGLLRLPGLIDTPAGRARRVMALEATLLLGFGPRLPAAVRELDAAFAARMG